MSKVRFDNAQYRHGDKVFRCAACLIPVKIGTYRMNHAKTVHGISHKKACGFCLGEYEFENNVIDYKHMHECLNKIIQTIKLEKRGGKPVKRKRSRDEKVFSFRNSDRATSVAAPIECSAELAASSSTDAPIETSDELSVSAERAPNSFIAAPVDSSEESVESSSVVVLATEEAVIAAPVDSSEESVASSSVVALATEEASRLPLRWCDECICFESETETAEWNDLATIHCRWREKGMFEAKFEKPNWWPPTSVRFDEESGLGHEVASVLSQFDKYTFFHAGIRAFSLQNCFARLEEIDDWFAALPFWCVCDGHDRKYDGVDEECGEEMQVLETSIEHHRHMLLATQHPEKFLAAWKRIRVDDDCRNCFTTDARVRGTFIKQIKDRHHLVNAMAYVCGRKSSGCSARNLSEIVLGNRESQGCHYFLARLWPEHARVSVFSLYTGGLEQYVNQCLRNRSAWTWLDDVNCETAADGYPKYWVPVSRTGLKVEGCPIPLAADLEIDWSGETGGGMLHLMEGATCGVRPRRREVQSRRERLKSDERNRFAEALGEFKYYLSKIQVREVNALLAYRNALDLRVREKETQLQAEKLKVRDALRRLEEKETECRKSLDTVRRLEEKDVEWQAKCESLKAECEYLKTECECAKDECECLKGRVLEAKRQTREAKGKMREAKRQTREAKTKVSLLESENRRLKADL